jgi:hypothetical protein
MTTKTRQNEFATPLGSADHAKLEVARGASRVTIHAEREVPDLFRARFEGPQPMVLGDDGRVTIEYPRISPSGWLRPDRRAAEVLLNASIPWEIVFSGGVSRLRADLSLLRLQSLELGHGVSDAELVLPRPRGIVRVEVRGGVSKAAIHRPAGVGVRLSLAGGATKLTLDDEHFGAMGGPMRIASRGSEDDADRYEIEISGGASELSIDERRQAVSRYPRT